MKNFLTIFSTEIKGSIRGFDRIVIKGIFKNLNYVEGMFSFLLSQKVLLKDFGRYVESKSQEFKEKSYAYVKELKRPIIYLNSGGIRKKEYAKKISIENNIKEGLICLLKTVDPFATTSSKSSTPCGFSPPVTTTVFSCGRFSHITIIFDKLAASVTIPLASLLDRRYSNASVPKRVNSGMATAPTL